MASSLALKKIEDLNQQADQIREDNRSRKSNIIKSLTELYQLVNGEEEETPEDTAVEKAV